MKPHMISLANEAGSPPDIRELQTYDLCRLTNRSHSNLLSVAGLCRGNIELFYTSLGYSKTTRLTRNNDTRYWYMMLNWISIYIPLFEAKFMEIMADLSIVQLPDVKEIHKRLADTLGLPMDFLNEFEENRTHIIDYLDAIRSDMGAMAEVKLLQLIVAGDAPTIRWYLQRAIPERYNLNSAGKDTSEKTVEVIFT